MIRAIAILGSTGSIGESTLDVVRRHPALFSVHTLTGYRNIDRLAMQCREFEPARVVVATESLARDLKALLGKTTSPIDVCHGPEALENSVTDPAIDAVVTGIVGSPGLRSTFSAVSAGKTVLVANKEPLVMAGSLIVECARQSGATILPVDSEHNAIFQCLPRGFSVTAESRANASTLDQFGVEKIVLTASGGPFRETPLDDLHRVTPDQAAAHPNWDMGRKISIDSATLMNKGLELIEACVLFDLPPQRVEVVIHPQSVIHSLVCYQDGSTLAQLGGSDMRIPIANALGWPERINSGVQVLDLTELSALEFEAPDEERFPCLRLAREAACSAGTTPVILNAANEIAVESFCAGIIPFTGIAPLVEEVLSACPAPVVSDLEEIMAVDTEAREETRNRLT